MPSPQAIKDLARAYTREELAGCPSFASLSVDDQRAMFRDIYRKRYDELAHAQSGNGRRVARALAGRASDMIDESRHENKRLDDAGEMMGEFVDEVDFPGFVRDLLKGVFDANLEVTLKQMETYQELLKTATASISKFVNAIDNTAAFGYLAENQGDDFSFDLLDEKDESGEPVGALTDKDGNVLARSNDDLGDNEVKAKIMEAKIAMAREHRALLRETILMGISRLVVEKGNVKASVLFDFKATEAIDRSDKAGRRYSKTSGGSAGFSGGLIGKVFGGPFGSGGTSRKLSTISVASTKSVTNTQLAAQLKGSVDITFKSDYFKLDNFARMYGPVTEAEKAEAAAGAADGATVTR